MNTRHLYLSACAVAFALSAVPLRAAEGDTHSTPQREKFAACAHDSKGLKGEDRRAFMSECLRKHGDADAHAKPAVLGDAGHRLPSCNAEADRRKLQGDERHAFVHACLQG